MSNLLQDPEDVVRFRENLYGIAKKRDWNVHTGSDPQTLALARLTSGKLDPKEYSDRRLVFAHVNRKALEAGQAGAVNIFTPLGLMRTKYRDILHTATGSTPDPHRLERFVATMQGHEFTEAGERVSGVRGKFGSHASERVIHTEMAMAKSFGQQTLADMINFRKWEASTILSKRRQGDPSLSNKKHWDNYLFRMHEILQDQEAIYKQTFGQSVPLYGGKGTSTVLEGNVATQTAKKPVIKKPVIRSRNFSNLKGVAIGAGISAVLIPAVGFYTGAFSGKDDAYNTIEGMKHGGYAEKMRKQLTDFGSGYKAGFALIGLGTAGILGARGIGIARGAKHEVEPESKDKMSFLTKAALGIAITAGLGFIAAPASVYLQGMKGGLGHAASSKLFKTQVSVANDAAKMRFSAISDIYSKETTERLKSQAITKGIYSSKINRALAPVLEFARGVHHTSDWLKKNWIPELKRGEGGAVGLAALTAYEGYHIGKSAYEGDWEGVGKGLISFGGAKYAYMGWKKFLNSSEKRKEAAGWLKKQKLADFASYAMTGISTLNSIGKYAAEAAMLYPQFVRTGASPLAIAKEYGTNAAIGTSEAVHRIVGRYKKTWEEMTPEARKKLISEDMQKQIGEGFEREAKKFQEGISAFKELNAEDLQRNLNSLAPEAVKAEKHSWLGGHAVKKISESDPSKITNARDLIFGLVEKGKLRANGAINSIPGRDDAYNTIEGLKHGGQAEQLRKEMTDFGSGYDPAKFIAKTLGMSFEDLIGSKMFKEAIESGTKLKFLGSGGYGETYLMKANIAGHELQYVKKVPLENLSTTRQELSDFAKDFDVQKALHETSFAPSPYLVSQDKSVFYMELMPGRSLLDYHHLEQVGDLPLEKIREATKSAVQEISERGIINPDIAARNLMYDKETGRVSMIDFGMAKKTENVLEQIKGQWVMGKQIDETFIEGAAIQEKQKKQHTTGFVTSSSPESLIPIAESPISRTSKRITPNFPKRDDPIAYARTSVQNSKRTKQKLVQSSIALRQTQKQTWQNAISGGRKHQSKTRKSGI